ncbi:hypothetical protein PISMIDRAFT_10306 [Pisolithus microcarpus 441]|uniref:Uncharacterized protein n=1 Tax=Pisolithus microcarpus 441 TaxID=765257 RepID=A0A0C9Z5B3_9AGAM|nr:hypothetical protein BKA83DRAFT_10306 [Pisolithus microcarpus]KIK24311.1 hypothetical protein PISMIDRAFT_10306 [Pisolithus microcarpus 441]
MVTLTKIDLELHLAGLKFEQQQWLDFMGVTLLDPAEGLNSIKMAQELMQEKTNPLLEDPAAWQLVLQWAADNNLSFTNFLTEMEGKFQDRYKFNEWKTIFDQVFKASRDGTTIEVVRAAMTKHGVLNRPSVQDLSLQASSSDKLPPCNLAKPLGNPRAPYPQQSVQDQAGALPSF